MDSPIFQYIRNFPEPDYLPDLDPIVHRMEHPWLPKPEYFYLVWSLFFMILTYFKCSRRKSLLFMKRKHEKMYREGKCLILLLCLFCLTEQQHKCRRYSGRDTLWRGCVCRWGCLLWMSQLQSPSPLNSVALIRSFTLWREKLHNTLLFCIQGIGWEGFLKWRVQGKGTVR